MPLKDLRGKTVYDLELGDFEKLFCSQCKDSGICVKDKSMPVCKQLIDNGVWDILFRKRRGE